jgi:hypothetical protein
VNDFPVRPEEAQQSAVSKDERSGDCLSPVRPEEADKGVSKPVLSFVEGGERSGYALATVP